MQDGAFHPLANGGEDLGDKVGHAIVHSAVLVGDELAMGITIAFDASLQAILNDPLERNKTEVELHGGRQVEAFFGVGRDANGARILGGRNKE